MIDKIKAEGFSTNGMVKVAARGLAIEELLGGNLPRSFPVIDRLSGGVATSIKSVDITLPGIRNSNTLLSTLRGYINKLDNFKGANWDGKTVN